MRAEQCVLGQPKGPKADLRSGRVSQVPEGRMRAREGGLGTRRPLCGQEVAVAWLGRCDRTECLGEALGCRAPSM